ncbi:MAG: hypothetical protein WD607_05935 [Candidatus Paceibacterota bacterium]
MSEKVEDIDAVITWIDANDPEYRNKRMQVIQDSSISRNEIITGRDKTRFVDNGELEYCIHSIIKFAPWIRTIYLVTDNQCPDFITEEFKIKHRIHLIDHSTIFESFESVLPTFNSRTIESVLWRIPGLASRFIYFNDDFVLTDFVKPDDFFIGDKVKLRGRWKRMKNYGSIRMRLNKVISEIARRLFSITRSMHHLLQIKSAKRAGFEKKYFKIPHVPHPLKRDTIKDFFEKNPNILKQNIQYRFRSTDQISAIYVANHTEIKNHKVVYGNMNEFMMINGEMDLSFILESKLNRIIDRKVKFVCLQGIERLSDKLRERLDDVMRSHLDMDQNKTS